MRPRIRPWRSPEQTAADRQRKPQLPSRYWVKSESGKWYSVARNKKREVVEQKLADAMRKLKGD